MKKLVPFSFSFTIVFFAGTSDHFPASASSQSSESDRPESIGTRFSATYFSLSGITPGGRIFSTRLDSARENSVHVG